MGSWAIRTGQRGNYRSMIIKLSIAQKEQIKGVATLETVVK